MAAPALLTLVLTAAAVNGLSVVHITDVHIDPYYEVGSIAQGCYCETHDTCPRFPPSCQHTDDPVAAAGPFGDADADCATPSALWASTMTFLNTSVATSSADIVLFTGDFGSAGLAAPCSATGTPARQQIVDVATTAFRSVRAALPNARVYGAFGNHDSTSADGWGSSSDMAWLYGALGNASGALGHDLAGDVQALASLQAFGWYATAATPSLTIIALNTNYWAAFNDNVAAPALSAAQFTWLNATLRALAATGQHAWVIGHIPPHDGAWVKGHYTRYREIVSLFPETVLAAFFGHQHVDVLTLVRSCNASAAPPAPPAPYAGPWVETPGLEWCSGGNLPVGDVWGLGYQPNAPWCPYVAPANGTLEGRVALCEGVCGANASCAGFTYYFDKGGACCMRTDTHDKPPDPSSTALCFEKVPPPPPCGDAQRALHVLFSGPSLTEGFPPSNPALRVYEADSAANYAVREAATYSADLRQGNAAWDLSWGLEYAATQAFNLSGGGAGAAGSWERAFAAWGADGSAGWSAFQGFYTKGYSSPGCEGDCKAALLGWMNGSSVDV